MHFSRLFLRLSSQVSKGLRALISVGSTERKPQQQQRKHLAAAAIAMRLLRGHWALGSGSCSLRPMGDDSVAVVFAGLNSDVGSSSTSAEPCSGYLRVLS